MYMLSGMKFNRGRSDRCACVHADLLADLSASQLLAQASWGVRLLGGPSDMRLL